MAGLKPTPWDAADDLETQQDIASYLEAGFDRAERRAGAGVEDDGHGPAMIGIRWRRKETKLCYLLQCCNQWANGQL